MLISFPRPVINFVLFVVVKTPEHPSEYEALYQLQGLWKQHKLDVPRLFWLLLERSLNHKERAIPCVLDSRMQGIPCAIAVCPIPSQNDTASQRLEEFQSRYSRLHALASPVNR